jgi:membrane protease YdiL (CAAX protease family)
MSDQSTYGRVRPRSIWIAREFGLLLAVWSCTVAYSVTSWMQPVVFRLSWSDLTSTIGALLAYCAVIWVSGDDWSHFGLIRPRAKQWVVGLALFVAASYHMLTRLPAVLSYADVRLHWIALAFGACFYFPLGLAEEIFFRGLVQSRATEIFKSPWLGIGASSLTFTLGHFYLGPTVLWYHALFGLGYGYARYRGVSIWVLAVSHGMVNAFIGFGYPTDLLRLLQF